MAERDGRTSKGLDRFTFGWTYLRMRLYSDVPTFSDRRLGKIRV